MAVNVGYMAVQKDEDSMRTITVDGVTRATWDDDAETYTEFAEDGVTVTLSRAYTAVELAVKAQDEAFLGRKAVSAALYAQAGAAVDDLLTSMGTLRSARDLTNGTINANPAVYVKALANQVLVTDKALVALARLLSGRNESADTGAI